jgi:L-2-hydroxyglutarate oxidase
VEDFHITVDGRSAHVLNAPSPGATASLAIGEEIAGRLLQTFTL